ncbi:PREDICTED: transposase [Prunus dulcis]|uniref:PREDICTED: transposase n=1 Tax=Prunus dulcis TaxID=3755 RepID=A0A5E4FXF1_PRUDU|nr:PREDICTED: transposase [Prunus dulcis]
MDPAYTTWVFHGESLSDDVQYEDVEMPEANRFYHDFYFQDDEVEGYPCDSKEAEIENFVREVETPLFLGCTKYTKMSAIVTLLKYKATNSLTDSAFDEMLQIFGDILPENNTLPGSLYSTKKIFKAFELGYEKIHACMNDCCLFRHDLEMVEECPKCGSSRWKVNQRNSKIEKGSLQKINKKWPSFELDPRSIRFGLSTDGFNPFQDLSSRYNYWSVVLVTYNLSPWLCMSKESLMLTLLVPGPKQPGNDIDIYLAPLIDDLKDLWNNGVKVYDAFSKEKFNLKAVLM